MENGDRVKNRGGNQIFQPHALSLTYIKPSRLPPKGVQGAKLGLVMFFGCCKRTAEWCCWGHARKHTLARTHTHTQQCYFSFVLNKVHCLLHSQIYFSFIFRVSLLYIILLFILPFLVGVSIHVFTTGNSNLFKLLNHYTQIQYNNKTWISYIMNTFWNNNYCIEFISCPILYRVEDMNPNTQILSLCNSFLI